MFKILIPAVACLGLVAFAAKTQPIATGIEPASAVQPMAWHLSKEGEVAKLAYGVAHSDQLAMRVTCAPGDATAAIDGDFRPVGAASPDSDGMAETRVPVRDPALQKLAAKGSMTVVGEDGAFRIRASVQERRGISQFLDYCSRTGA